MSINNTVEHSNDKIIIQETKQNTLMKPENLTAKRKLKGIDVSDCRVTFYCLN